MIKERRSVRKFKNEKVDRETWTQDMLKPELFDLCSRFAAKPEFLIEKIARKAGHSVLRTPPYHPELQPIETCWAIVKNYAAQHNDYTMKKVLTLLEEGFGKVTEKNCQKLIKNIYSQEEAFWDENTATVT